MTSTSIGFLPEEVRTDESTRAAKLKWVVVVDGALPGGQAVNAAVCVAAAARADVFVADMPSQAQRTRVYDEYLGHLADAGDDQITYCAVSIVGPRNAVDTLVKRLSLLP